MTISFNFKINKNGLNDVKIVINDIIYQFFDIGASEVTFLRKNLFNNPSIINYICWAELD